MSGNFKTTTAGFIIFGFLSSVAAYGKDQAEIDAYFKTMRETEVKELFCTGKTVETFKGRSGSEKTERSQFSGPGFLTFYERPEGGTYVDVDLQGATTAELSNEMKFQMNSDSYWGSIIREQGGEMFTLSLKLNRRTGDFEIRRFHINRYGSRQENSVGVCEERSETLPPKKF